jgi:hypothetical protein
MFQCGYGVASVGLTPSGEEGMVADRGGGETISRVKRPVPEPSSRMLSGLVGLDLRVRREEWMWFRTREG